MAENNDTIIVSREVRLGVWRRRLVLLARHDAEREAGIVLGGTRESLTESARLMHAIAAHGPLTVADGRLGAPHPDGPGKRWVVAVADGIAQVGAFRDAAYAPVRRREDECFTVALPQARWRHFAIEVEEVAAALPPTAL